MDINFKGAYFTIQKALPMLNDNASIILNTSINVQIGMPNTSVYAASKAALITLARTLSAESLNSKESLSLAKWVTTTPSPQSTALTLL